MVFRVCVVAAFCIAALFAPAAMAAQTVSVAATCKYPLIANRADTMTMALDTPTAATAGGPVTVTIGAASWASTGLSSLASFIDDFSALNVAGEALTDVSAGGWTKRIAPAMGATRGTAQPDVPTVLAGTGGRASFVIHDPGTATLQGAGWHFNVQAKTSDGTVLTLPPLTSDANGHPVSDTDGNAGTFDVYCIPSATSVPIYGTFDVATRAIPQAPTAASGSTTRAQTAAAICRYPLVANVAESISVELDAPVSATAGSPVSSSVKRLAFPSEGLRRLASLADDFASVEGTGSLRLDLATGGWERSRNVAFSLRPLNPNPDVATTVESNSGSIGFVINQPGEATLRAGAWRFNLRAKDSNGNVIALPALREDPNGNVVADSDGDPNTFDVYCVPGTTVPSFALGPSHGSINVAAVAASLNVAYSARGTLTLRKLAKSPAPVAGTFAGKFNTASGSFSGSLVLNDTQVRLVSASATPVTATIGITPSGGEVFGAYRAGLFTTNHLIRIKVKSAKVFGAVPIAMGNNCQSKSFSTLELRSDGSGSTFAPEAGGPAAGSFALSDLNGCAGLEGMLDPATQGDGNALALTLARQ